MLLPPLAAIVVAGLSAAATAIAPYARERSRRIEYADLPPAIQHSFADAGGAPAFAAYVRTVEADTARRVAEGEREHLIYYALQSTRFTSRARIEPALSARRFVERLSPEARARLLDDPSYLPAAGWPSAERARVDDLLRALGTGPKDTRLAYFSRLLLGSGRAPGPADLYPDYVRAVRFLYRKEFLSGGDAAEVGRLYQSRPHSSDTQIDAGFAVSVGLGTLHALEPSLRVSRALVIGPGLDLAPRTDLVDAIDPQSYQPFALADALLAHSLSSERELRVHSVDINPRVVGWLQDAARGGPTLHLFTGVAERADQPFAPEYRTYVRELGRAIGERIDAPRDIAADPRYHHSIAVRASVARTMSAEALNVITERLIDEPLFDLAVVTNVLTYFDDRQLALALSNIAAMVRPGGYLIHNESRASLPEIAGMVGLPVLQMRSVILGGPRSRPLYDVVFLHRRGLGVGG